MRSWCVQGWQRGEWTAGARSPRHTCTGRGLRAPLSRTSRFFRARARMHANLTRCAALGCPCSWAGWRVGGRLLVPRRGLAADDALAGPRGWPLRALHAAVRLCGASLPRLRGRAEAGVRRRREAQAWRRGRRPHARPPPSAWGRACCLPSTAPATTWCCASTCRRTGVREQPRAPPRAPLTPPPRPAAATRRRGHGCLAHEAGPHGVQAVRGAAAGVLAGG